MTVCARVRVCARARVTERVRGEGVRGGGGERDRERRGETLRKKKDTCRLLTPDRETSRQKTSSRNRDDIEVFQLSTHPCLQ